MEDKKKSKSKKRPQEYEPKVKFDGTFGDMIKMSIQDADKKKAKVAPKKD